MSVSLSQELLHELSGIHLPEGSESTDRNPGRRAAQRVAVTRQAKVHPLQGRSVGEAITIDVRDLSASGVGFRAKHAFAAGDQLVLSLLTQSGEYLTLLCSVVRCEPLSGTSRFVTGATFEQILSGLSKTEATVRRLREAILGEVVS
jgi:hypothetical protein